MLKVIIWYYNDIMLITPMKSFHMHFFIFIIFLLAKKTTKKLKQEQKVVLMKTKMTKTCPTNAETKLIALKDLQLNKN